MVNNNAFSCKVNPESFEEARQNLLEYGFKELRNNIFTYTTSLGNTDNLRVFITGTLKRNDRHHQYFKVLRVTLIPRDTDLEFKVKTEVTNRFDSKYFANEIHRYVVLSIKTVFNRLNRVDSEGYLVDAEASLYGPSEYMFYTHDFTNVVFVLNTVGKVTAYTIEGNIDLETEGTSTGGDLYLKFNMDQLAEYKEKNVGWVYKRFHEDTVRKRSYECGVHVDSDNNLSYSALGRTYKLGKADLSNESFYKIDRLSQRFNAYLARERLDKFVNEFVTKLQMTFIEKGLGILLFTRQEEEGYESCVRIKVTVKQNNKESEFRFTGYPDEVWLMHGENNFVLSDFYTTELQFTTLIKGAFRDLGLLGIYEGFEYGRKFEE